MEIQAPGAGSGELTRARRVAAARSRRAAALAALVCVALLAAACGRDEAGDGTGKRASEPEEVVLTPEAAREGLREQREQPRAPNSKAQVVELLGAGSADSIEVDPNDDAPSPGAPTDAEVRTELREARESLSKFKQHLNSTAFLQTGPRARVLSDGTAVAPENAPEVVKRVILAANEIAKFPYKWGGGHGAWRDNGYDCSGSVSFALAGAGLLRSPLTSGGFLELRRARPRQVDHDLHAATATSSWSSAACASTRAGRAAPARAGRTSRARPPASRCVTSPGSSRCTGAPRPSPSAVRAPSGEAPRRAASSRGRAACPTRCRPRRRSGTPGRSAARRRRRRRRSAPTQRRRIGSVRASPRCFPSMCG